MLKTACYHRMLMNEMEMALVRERYCLRLSPPRYNVTEEMMLVAPERQGDLSKSRLWAQDSAAACSVVAIANQYHLRVEQYLWWSCVPRMASCLEAKTRLRCTTQPQVPRWRGRSLQHRLAVKRRPPRLLLVKVLPLNPHPLLGCFSEKDETRMGYQAMWLCLYYVRIA